MKTQCMEDMLLAHLIRLQIGTTGEVRPDPSSRDRLAPAQCPCSVHTCCCTKGIHVCCWACRSGRPRRRRFRTRYAHESRKTFHRHPRTDQRLRRSRADGKRPCRHVAGRLTELSGRARYQRCVWRLHVHLRAPKHARVASPLRSAQHPCLGLAARYLGSCPARTVHSALAKFHVRSSHARNSHPRRRQPDHGETRGQRRDVVQPTAADGLCSVGPAHGEGTSIGSRCPCPSFVARTFAGGPHP